jgi:hypothetical protein
MGIKRLKTFTVERATWLRGTDQSALLIEDGRMCCLGFLCLAYGVTRKAIEDVSMPEGVTAGHRKLPAWLRDDDWDSSVHALSEINDSKDISDKTRERRLAREFAKHKLGVKFV